MSSVTALHNAVRRGDLARVRALLVEDARLANSRNETDVRGTYPLHVAAESGQPAAARLLLEHGADVSLLDAENGAIALCWAAFFGRPEGLLYGMEFYLRDPDGHILGFVQPVP
jgi:ankyrin repeat protein